MRLRTHSELSADSFESADSFKSADSGWETLAYNLRYSIVRCNVGGTRTLYKSSKWYEGIKTLGITALVCTHHIILEDLLPVQLSHKRLKYEQYYSTLLQSHEVGFGLLHPKQLFQKLNGYKQNYNKA